MYSQQVGMILGQMLGLPVFNAVSSIAPAENGLLIGRSLDDCEELIEIKNKYSDPRRSEITADDSDLNIADLIPRHSCVITVSNTGYIKRVPSDTYRTQHRGGKGIIGMETKEEDYVEHLFNADSHDLIFFFTDRGFMYWLNVYDIPEGARTGKGKAIVNLIKLEPNEQIRTMLTVKKKMFEENEELCIAMATRCGVIKKTPLSQFRHLRKIGIRALTIEEGDDLIGAEIADGASEIILSTAKAMRSSSPPQRVWHAASRAAMSAQWEEPHAA